MRMLINPDDLVGYAARAEAWILRWQRGRIRSVE
jgi:hypothetical protein